MANTSSQTIINAAIATGVSENFTLMREGSSASPKRTFHAYGTTSSGAGSATIMVEVSNFADPGTAANGQNWVTAATITLTLATTQSGDGVAIDAAWRWVRARLSAISGTGATVSVLMGS